MKSAFPLIFVAALAGCAGPTPQSITQNGVAAAFSSSKAPKPVAQCIASKWEETKVLGGSAIVNVRETSAGYQVALRMNDRMHYMATVDAQGAGSQTSVYRAMVMSIGSGDRHYTEAGDCQK